VPRSSNPKSAVLSSAHAHQSASPKQALLGTGAQAATSGVAPSTNGHAPTTNGHVLTSEADVLAASGQLVLDFEGRKRRLRYGPLPKPPSEVKVPYAKRHDKKDTDEGEVVAWLTAQPEWLETVGAECDAIDSERAKKGPCGSYTARELEGILFYGAMCGIRTYRSVRNRLASDRGQRACVALGLTQERERRCPSDRKLTLGIPSEATMSRHKKSFPVERHKRAYFAYYDRLRKLNAQDPELRKALRHLYMDGVKQLTTLTCPKYDLETRRIVNAGAVTCPDGGFIGRDAPESKQGMGFALVTLTCANALPWSYSHGPINLSEADHGMRALKDFNANVLSVMGEPELRVLTADSGFQKPALRALCRKMGISENISEVSHVVGRASTERERESGDRRQLDIGGYPNWFANGHREVKCRCGCAEFFRRFGLKGRRAFARVEGRCPNCGNVTFTSGLWKTVKDTTRPVGDVRGAQKLMRVQKGDPADVVDWAFGNPLTFNDLIARVLGARRFGHNEGFNGACATRYKALCGYFRNKAEAELRALMVFCAMHGETQYRRET